MLAMVYSAPWSVVMENHMLRQSLAQFCFGIDFITKAFFFAVKPGGRIDRSGAYFLTKSARPSSRANF